MRRGNEVLYIQQSALRYRLSVIRSAFHDSSICLLRFSLRESERRRCQLGLRSRRAQAPIQGAQHGSGPGVLRKGKKEEANIEFNRRKLRNETTERNRSNFPRRWFLSLLCSHVHFYAKKSSKPETILNSGSCGLNTVPQMSWYEQWKT